MGLALLLLQPGPSDRPLHPTAPEFGPHPSDLEPRKVPVRRFLGGPLVRDWRKDSANRSRNPVWKIGAARSPRAARPESSRELQGMGPGHVCGRGKKNR
jgi:hypothetical protein